MAHLGPGGPVAGARAWLEAIATGHYEEARRLTDPAWRNELADRWDALVAEWSEAEPAGWAAGSRPRIVGVDTEIVKLINTPGDEVALITEPTLMPGIALIVHHTGDGWLVAGLAPEGS